MAKPPALPNTTPPNPATSSGPLPQPLPTPLPAKTPAETSLVTPSPNPNRRTFTAQGDLMATRLINPHNARLTPEQIKEIETQGVERITIVINSLRQHHTTSSQPVHSLGIAIKNRHRIVFMKYPMSGTLSEQLPYALEEAVLRTPGMANLELMTPHKELWDSANYTARTQERLRDFGSRLQPTHPQSHDLANILCRMAADDILMPKAVDYHIYTGCISDGQRAYTAAILWGNQHANFFLQALPTTDLALAETKAAEWAFRLLEDRAQMMLTHSNPELAAVWEGQTNLRPDLRKAIIPLAALIRDRHLSFKQGVEPYHHQLAKAAKQMAANLYASTPPDFRPETLRKRRKKKSA